MKWNERYEKANQPALEQISGFVDNPLWQELHGYLEQAYGVAPTVEHSICSMSPGWNVKYKKSGRSLCTLYPAEGFFTCLVSIGAREAVEAELLLPCCTEYVRELYAKCQPFNGGRWLMIDVTSPEILEDAKALIATRAKPKRGKGTGDS